MFVGFLATSVLTYVLHMPLCFLCLHAFDVVTMLSLLGLCTLRILHTLRVLIVLLILNKNILGSLVRQPLKFPSAMKSPRRVFFFEMQKYYFFFFFQAKLFSKFLQTTLKSHSNLFVLLFFQTSKYIWRKHNSEKQWFRFLFFFFFFLIVQF